MANTYNVLRVAGNHSATTVGYSVHRTPAHSSTGADVFVAAGDKAEERAAYVCAMFNRTRSADDERFLQRLLAGDKAADNELRAIVGAKPRSERRGGRFASPFAA